jgi:hypothetical protein
MMDISIEKGFTFVKPFSMFKSSYIYLQHERNYTFQINHDVVFLTEKI